MNTLPNFSFLRNKIWSQKIPLPLNHKVLALICNIFQIVLCQSHSHIYSSLKWYSDEHFRVTMALLYLFFTYLDDETLVRRFVSQRRVKKRSNSSCFAQRKVSSKKKRKQYSSILVHEMPYPSGYTIKKSKIILP